MAVERITTEWVLSETTRHDLRAAVLQKWSEETPGTADKYERYKYQVETLPGNIRIYLLRPAWKNKGCDFTVHCEQPITGGQTRPSHPDLINELSAIAVVSAGYKSVITTAIEQIYNCQNVEEVCNTALPALNEEWRFRAERALKLAKWLFIEQDITDWNTSGRGMLMSGIRDSLNALHNAHA